ncbi:hypothetical protein N9B63_04465 [Akkermansiaceae bacterium]|nr:hypothetical protein [Akkermansiaceae bacterium]
MIKNLFRPLSTGSNIFLIAGIRENTIIIQGDNDNYITHTRIHLCLRYMRDY